METIIGIVMREEGLTWQEAERWVKEVRDEVYKAINGESGYDPEDVFTNELGLEPDYMEYIL